MENLGQKSLETSESTAMHPRIILWGSRNRNITQAYEIKLEMNCL